MSRNTSFKYSSGVSSSHEASPFIEDHLGLLGGLSGKKNNQLQGGERRLMAAMLSDGIESYIAHCSSIRFLETGRGDLANESYQWVHTKDYSYVFSFDNVCESLGIDPDYLRLGLARYLDSVKEMRESGQKKTWKKLRRPRKR